MPLIFFGSNGIGFISKLFGLGAAAGCAVPAGAGVCAAASPAPIAAVTTPPAVNTDPACTKLRRSGSVVMSRVLFLQTGSWRDQPREIEQDAKGGAGGERLDRAGLEAE